MKKILVTGGAGYIGSHTVRQLADKKYIPLIYDNLSTGYKEFVGDFEFIKGDIGDYDKLISVFKKHEIECVMNFASFIAVGESVKLPLKYYKNNLADTIELFRAMVDSGIKNFIFSSSAAVYGLPEVTPITENSPLNPINPYGRSKLYIEEILKDLDISDGIKSISLRYFNAAGASSSGDIGENHIPETHLIPLIMRAILDDSYTLNVFGTDYPTKDGTCIRDYIHVDDLASAHVLALEYLLTQNKSDVFNLGNGTGFSVNEVIQCTEKIAGKKCKLKYSERREGDAAVLVASSDKAKDALRWKSKYNQLENIIETAWKWESSGKRSGY
ncbi:MAG TPA: UDP-glucose 4-epimerase GalE [Deltaproteobacteria bacterium]|nr:UDP-glucose 4-epimerase GalE [Deltaproteobacteria bacterium]